MEAKEEKAKKIRLIERLTMLPRNQRQAAIRAAIAKKEKYIEPMKDSTDSHNVSSKKMSRRPECEGHLPSHGQSIETTGMMFLVLANRKVQNQVRLLRDWLNLAASDDQRVKERPPGMIRQS